MPDRSLAKDFHALMRNIDSISDSQATITKWDDENLGNFQVTVAPNDGPYKDGEFIFEIEVQKSTYPVIPPRVSCKTAIYHPNIDTIDDPEGEICFNLFEDDIWTEKCGLEDIVQGLLFLLHYPNWDDALVSLAPPFATREQVAENVQKSLKGGLVWKYWFPPNPRYARLHPEEESGAKVEGNENDPREDEEGESVEQRRETADEPGDGVECETDGDKGSSDGATENKFETLFFGIKKLLDFDSDDYDEDDFDDDYDEDEDEEELGGRNRVHTLLSILRHRRSRMNSNTDSSDEGSGNDDDNDQDADVASVHQDVSPVLCSDAFAPCNIDSDVVNDDELEELLELMDSADDDEDNADPAMDSSLKNSDGFESVVSWSRVVYGDGSSTSTGRFCPDSEYCLTPVISTTSLGQLKNSEQNSPRLVHRPTVMSRFFRALQTRTFRRWLV